MKDTVIEVRDFRKVYGHLIAVDGISFEVQQGEIFGLLGPNGAGKTSTLEVLEGLRASDGGVLQVMGADPTRESYKLRNLIGVQLQTSGLPDIMVLTDWKQKIARPTTLESTIGWYKNESLIFKPEKDKKQEKEEKQEKQEASALGQLVFGLIVICVGIMFYITVNNIVPARRAWPYFAIIVGLVVIVLTVFGSRVALKRHPRP